MLNKILLATASALLAGLFLYSSYSSSARSGLLDRRFARLADEVNSDPTSTWRANTEYVPYNRTQLKKMFNLRIAKTLPKSFTAAPVLDVSVRDLPENFDPREKWPQCDSFREVRDQSACGSCWAVAAAAAMSDRKCVGAAGACQKRISAEDLMECCSDCGDGCNGGELYESWAYAHDTGLVTGDFFGDKGSCKPYAFPPCNHHSSGPYDDCSKHDYDTPKCGNSCIKEYPVAYKDDKQFLKKVYNIQGEENIMKEIFTNGSVEAAFSVYEDFLLYKTGIYQHKTGNFLGGHAVKLMGWGVENGVKYWLAVNNWNENWGDKGTFRIKRGNDECGFEEDIVGGLY